MEPFSVERKFALWVGLMLLHDGHVVELPNGRPELHVHTGNSTKRILVSVRDEAVSRENGRAIIGKIADLQDPPDAVVFVTRCSTDMDSVSVIAVHQTREKWINEGRHYTIPCEHLGDFSRLHAWLSKMERRTGNST